MLNTHLKFNRYGSFSPIVGLLYIYKCPCLQPPEAMASVLVISVWFNSFRTRENENVWTLLDPGIQASVTLVKDKF